MSSELTGGSDEMVVIPLGYKITAIPGWAYNGMLRMYYYIPNKQYVTADSMTVEIPKEEIKEAQQKVFLHPHQIVSLWVTVFMVVAASISCLDIKYDFLPTGAKFAFFIGLYFVVMAAVVLFMTRPMPYEIEAYQRNMK